MAEFIEAITPTQASIISCRYFRHGICREGDHCKYLHDVVVSRPLIESVDRSAVPESTTSDSTGALDLPGGDGPFPTWEFPSSSTTLVEGGADTFGSENEEFYLGETGQTSSGAVLQPKPENWVRASVFVPGQLWKRLDDAIMAPVYEGDTYFVNDGAACNMSGPYPPLDGSAPYLHDGGAIYPPDSGYGFGYTCKQFEVCEFCNQAVLSPFNSQLREKHMQECVRHHEEEMEMSFAIQRSQDKVCGICMDVVWEKEPACDQRFGLLSNCAHVFCLNCIRKWRSAKQFEHKIVRACPECRVKSDFVTPSRYWVEDKSEKAKLIDDYKMALSKKHCKYFDRGHGECPFNDKCFYLHAYPDGKLATPKPARCGARRAPNAGEHNTNTSVHHIILFEIFEHLNDRVAELSGQLEDWDDIFLRWNLLDASASDDYTDDDDDDSDYSATFWA